MIEVAPAGEDTSDIELADVVIRLIFEPWVMTCAQEQELLADHDDNGARRMSIRVPI